MIKITKLNQKEDVYDLTVSDNHNFYSDNILVHNCVEITLPTSPISHIDDGGTESKLIKVLKSDIEEYKEIKKSDGDVYMDKSKQRN